MAHSFICFVLSVLISLLSVYGMTLVPYGIYRFAFFGVLLFTALSAVAFAITFVKQSYNK